MRSSERHARAIVQIVRTFEDEGVQAHLSGSRRDAAAFGRGIDLFLIFQRQRQPHLCLFFK